MFNGAAHGVLLSRSVHTQFISKQAAHMNVIYQG